MPYSIRKHGTGYQVVNRDTGEVHAKHTTRAKAHAQVRLLEGKDRNGHESPRRKPDRVGRLPDGRKVNIYFKGKRVKRGKTK